MRVIFVIASLSHGGAERHAITLVNRLAERGHECHVVYIKASSEQLDRIRLRDGGTVRCIGATRYFDTRALSEFATHISRIRPLVIVAANAYALMYSALALRLSRRRAPLAVTFHSMRLLNAKEQLQMALYRLFFWASDCLVFVCETQRRHWLRRGVFAWRNEVIYNGVDTEEFCDDGQRAKRGMLRYALGFSDADYVIGMLAVLRPEKNPVQLVEAVARLRQMGIPARALVIGDGEMRGEIEARAGELGVRSHVVITGFQRDVRPYVAACDAMVLCSHTEAFSLAAIEAMAMHRPVVHPEVGGAAEMIFPGRNGFLFPAGDTAALVDRLALLSDGAVRKRMGNDARAVTEGLFSETTMVDRYERLLLALSGACSSAERAVPAWCGKPARGGGRHLGTTVHPDHAGPRGG